MDHVWIGLRLKTSITCRTSCYPQKLNVEYICVLYLGHESLADGYLGSLHCSSSTTGSFLVSNFYCADDLKQCLLPGQYDSLAVMHGGRDFFITLTLWYRPSTRTFNIPIVYRTHDMKATATPSRTPQRLFRHASNASDASYYPPSDVTSYESGASTVVVL